MGDQLGQYTKKDFTPKFINSAAQTTTKNAMWGWVPFQSLGPVPLSISGVGSPCNPPTGGRIYCRYLAPWSTRLHSTAHSTCGSVPSLIRISGAGSPFNQWGWIPSLFCGVAPLSISGLGSPFKQYGWVPLQSTGGRIYCRYLAPWSIHPPSRRTACVVLSHRRSKSQGLGLLLLCGAESTVIFAGPCPFSIRGAGSPFKQSG